MTPRSPVIGPALAVALAGCLDGRKATVTGNPTATASFSASALDPDRAVQTPTEFAAAVVKAELLRGEDDSEPSVLFDGAEGDVGYELVDLTASDLEIWSGKVPARAFGTYTHARVTLAAVAQQIAYVDAEGATVDQGFAELLADVDNTDGAVEGLPAAAIPRGDVLVSVDAGPASWFQIDADRQFASSTVREDVTPYRDPEPGLPTQLLPLADPLVIEADGDYALTATFDVRGAFEYLDRDGDGAFEPFGDDHDGTLNGFEVSVRVPAVDLTAE